MMEKIEVPSGNSVNDIKNREKIIREYYKHWKSQNQEQRLFNLHLKDYINIRMISIVETSEHASKNYLSTLAVLQLDAILTNSRMVSVVNTDPRSKNQNQFEKMIIMEYYCMGIGTVKMTVGIKRSNKEKVQYCITSLSSI
ncbi:MAG: hypothetical protein MJZ73_05690 [Bacteroidaceae bacterium]|nr:hypothetical protein [Bacteroidaceae bacterium]